MLSKNLIAKFWSKLTIKFWFFRNRKKNSNYRKKIKRLKLLCYETFFWRTSQNHRKDCPETFADRTRIAPGRIDWQEFFHYFMQERKPSQLKKLPLLKFPCSSPMATKRQLYQFLTNATFSILGVDGPAIARKGISILGEQHLALAGLFLHDHKLTKVIIYNLQHTGITHGLFFLKISNRESWLFFYCLISCNILPYRFLSCRNLFTFARYNEFF